MRLLYLSGDPGIPVLGHKGASVHVRELASALCRLGAEVVIASPRIEPLGDVLDAPVELVPIPAIPTSASEQELRVALEEQRDMVVRIAGLLGVDAIYERYSLFGGVGVAAAETLGIPHALEVNAPLRDEARRFRTLPHPDVAAEIERDVFLRTGRILAVSEALRRWLEREGVEPGRIVARVPRNDADLVLGFCGSLKPWHGIEVLLAACAISFAEEQALRLEVVGTGPLEHLIHSADLPPERLRTFGALSHADALDRLRRWDVGVAPYLDIEDFYFSPLKIYEYMAAGLCPVASDLGDVPALLDNGSRGVLVPAGDAERLATAFIELARDRGRIAEFGSRAREYVLAAHTWENNARIALDSFGFARGLAA